MSKLRMIGTLSMLGSALLQACGGGDFEGGESGLPGSPEGPSQGTPPTSQGSAPANGTPPGGAPPVNAANPQTPSPGSNETPSNSSDPNEEDPELPVPSQEAPGPAQPPSTPEQGDGPSCSPATCAGLSRSCGEVADGCGGMLECGTCSSSETCNSAGQCECVPNCGARECGTEPACGQSCGVCPGGESCEGGTCVAPVQTLDTVATADNMLLISSADSSLANTSFPQSELGVGCNWVFSSLTGIQDFVCAISLVYFGIDEVIAGRSILDAQLVFNVEALPASRASYSLWAVFQNWRANVTWNSAPQVVLGTARAVNQPAGATLQIDVTDIVAAWASGSLPNFGFFLEPADVTFPFDNRLEATSLCSLESCPGSFRPRLVVVYQ